MKSDLIALLYEFLENEARSCSMDFGCVSPLYAFRMFGGQYALEVIENEITELRIIGMNTCCSH